MENVRAFHRGHLRRLGREYPGWTMQFIDEPLYFGKSIRLQGAFQEYTIRYYLVRNEYECVVKGEKIEHLVGCEPEFHLLFPHIKEFEAGLDPVATCPRCGTKFTDYCEQCERVFWENKECGGDTFTSQDDPF